MRYEAKTLTNDNYGHFLNTGQCFSNDGQWLVCDTRNADRDISSTRSIEMVNVQTGERKKLYQTTNQTQFGPGVGAASFSPVTNTVIFIHGIRNAGPEKPYGFTRRTGVAVDINNPQHLIFMDARNVAAPFTPGALRGGTHAHQWSGDGAWISFTYNDYVIEQAAKSDSKLRDLRTVGVMFPRQVIVPNTDNLENNNGAMYSVIVATVKEKPLPGSDEINKAFDECWIGKNGYRDAKGIWHNKAIAFQGNVVDTNGVEKTEIFIVDLQDELPAINQQALAGTADTRPQVPQNLMQQRISFLKHGVTGPRHWLRSTPDGNLIVFLTKDEAGSINAFGISPNGGVPAQLTFHGSGIQSGVDISLDGKSLAYVADNCVYVTDIDSKQPKQITQNFTPEEAPVNYVHWSPNGNCLAYNRYVKTNGERYLQIFITDVEKPMLRHTAGREKRNAAVAYHK